MPTAIHWINAGGPARLGIMARPRAGDWLEDEIQSWLSAGVEVVVSLLEREEVSELGLEMEAAICRSAGIEFLSFPVADRGVPAEPGSALALAAGLAQSKRSIVIHCRAGIGRSAVLA